MGFQGNLYGSPGYTGTVGGGGGGSDIDPSPVPLTLMAGWEGTLTYQKKLDGTVALFGNLTPPNPLFMDAFAVLPVGRRPSETLFYLAYDTGDEWLEIELDTTGEMFPSDFDGGTAHPFTMDGSFAPA